MTATTHELLARAATGASRETGLLAVIAGHSDCFYLDGTSVGGYARLVLAGDLISAGRAPEAASLVQEIQGQFADHLDHEGNPLGDAVRALELQLRGAGP